MCVYQEPTFKKDSEELFEKAKKEIMGREINMAEVYFSKAYKTLEEAYDLLDKEFKEKCHKYAKLKDSIK